jgi:NTP pyrophosphatase (non-canonical NTP hydrolase)
MKLKKEFEPIRNWASQKGIYSKGDIKTQYVKLQEEAGELAKAIINNDKDEIIDAIGDCVVVLTSVAYFSGITIEECINSAYNVIVKRKGQMVNGSFIKNK